MPLDSEAPDRDPARSLSKLLAKLDLRRMNLTKKLKRRPPPRRVASGGYADVFLGELHSGLMVALKRSRLVVVDEELLRVSSPVDNITL